MGILPFFHIYGFTILLGLQMHAGTTVVIMERFDPVLYLKLHEQHQINFSYMAPPLVNFLVKQPIVDKYDLKKLKNIFCAAAPLGQELGSLIKEKISMDKS